MKTALLIGSTGLIGSHLLQILLQSDNYDNVITFVRKDSRIKHPKLRQHIVDFDTPKTYQDFIKGDDFYCTIGTTIKTAGSEEAFRKVDYQYPKQFATIALENGVKQFLLVSSLSADENSSNFYLKTKGEIQSFLNKSNFESVSIAQPSLLLGDRQEFRFGEQVGAILMKTFSFLLIGSLKKYKPIHGDTVAKALFALAQKNKTGFEIYESDKLQQLGN